VPTFGLFAPVSKVARVAMSAAARRGPGSVSRIPVGPTLMSSRERSGSQESLSSVGSMTSNVSRSRLRLGVTSLATQVVFGIFIISFVASIQCNYCSTTESH